jgi:hypothetical protein
MTLQLRRVVTGHDADGRAVVKIDEVSKISSRAGRDRRPVWSEPRNLFPLTTRATPAI